MGSLNGDFDHNNAFSTFNDRVPWGTGTYGILALLMCLGMGSMYKQPPTRSKPIDPAAELLLHHTDSKQSKPDKSYP